jgi:hypothetical protein
VLSADDSNAVISTKIEEEMCMKGEDEAIAISFSSVKDKPEVSPQTYHQYIRLPSVIMPFCLPAFT